MAISNALSNYIKTIDYFGVSLPFRLDNRKYHTSMLGGVVFLIFLLITCAYSLYNFINYVKFDNYNIVNMETKTFDPNPINFKNHNFSIALGITLNNVINKTIQEKYFKLRLKYKSKDRANNTSEDIVISLDKYCKLEEFAKYNISKTDFDQFALSNFYCPDLNSFRLQGQFVNDFFSYIKIEVEILDLLTNESLKEAQNYFRENDIKLQIYYNDVNLQINTVNSIKTFFINSLFTNLDFAFYKKMNAFFMESKVYIDDNPIISVDGNLLKFINIKNTQEYFQYFGINRFNLTFLQSEIPNFNKKKHYDGVLNQVAVIYLRASEYSSYTKKTFYKFTELIADTSMILQIILLVFFIIITSINEFKALETLVTKTMKFKGNLEEQDDVDFNSFNQVFKKENRKQLEELKKALSNPSLKKNNSAMCIILYKYSN